VIKEILLNDWSYTWYRNYRIIYQGKT
jgi:hypothetical protein